MNANFTIVDVFCDNCKKFLDIREREVTIENMHLLLEHKDLCRDCCWFEDYLHNSDYNPKGDEAKFWKYSKDMVSKECIELRGDENGT